MAYRTGSVRWLIPSTASKNCRSVCAETELGNWANGFTLTKLPRLNNLPKQLTLAGGKVRDYANLVKLRKQPLER